MMISFYFTLLFFCVKQDFVTCVNVKMPLDFLTVALGASLTLNCTYNCSSGFVRGCWSKASDDSVCHGTIRQSSFCTVSLHLSNVSVEDLKKNYTCYTLQTDDIKLPQKTERIVILQLQAQTRAPNWTVILKTETKNAQTRAPNWTIIPKTETKNESLPTEPKDSSGGELTGIKLLAPVTVVVAIVLAVLAVYLGLNWNRQCWICKGESAVSRSISPLPPHSVLSPVKGPLSSQSERVTLRIPTPDNGSDTEVPYADIMITVRGVSTPELTQVGCLTPGDQKEWWGDESRSHLQASRSADRLHVPQPREVSRKMSTNSEYAVITYA